MPKKIFIISAAVFVILIGAYFALKYFGDKKNEENLSEQVQQQQNIQLENQNTTSEKIKKIVDGRASGATLDSTGTKIVFFQNNNFLSTDFDGSSKSSISTYPFDGVEDINWDNNCQKAILKIRADFYMYYLNSDKAEKMKSGIDEIVFSALGDKIIYKYYDPSSKTRSINIANPDGTSWDELRKLDFQKVDFQINPSNGDIGFFQTPDSFVGGEFSIMNFSGENLRKITQPKYGANFLWSSDGDKILTSFVSERGGNKLELGVMNSSGGEYQALGFPSVADKCVWSSDNVNLYCAMLSSPQPQVVLPNDWQNSKLASSDTFWKIDTKSGKKTRLVELSEITDSLDSEKLFLDNDERFLFFTDKNSGSIYRINLQ